MQAHSHMHAYGGAAQLEVGYLTVSDNKVIIIGIGIIIIIPIVKGQYGE